MSEPVNPLVIDLSHWDPAYDYNAVKADGIVAVIYKATEGSGYRDPTYVEQQKAAKAAGLRWGAYHFANGADVDSQVENFMTYACPDPDELFVLDWEDNPGGSKMSVSQAKEWITQVEDLLGRPGECVIYGGNTLKEMIDHPDEFFAARRLWLCQYGSSPVLPESWNSYWLWQFTDGVYGPSPHEIAGVGPCDINSYQGTAESLLEEWTQETPAPKPEPGDKKVDVTIVADDGVSVYVTVNGSNVHASTVRSTAQSDARRRIGEFFTRHSKKRWQGIRESRQRGEAAGAQTGEKE